MAQQTIGIGLTANDGTGDPLRTVFQKCNDNFTELYNLVAGLGAPLELADFYRGQLDEVCDGTSDSSQVITFSTPMPSANYVVTIIDYSGNSVQQAEIDGVKTQDANGFTINSLSLGVFGYIALIEV